MRIGLSSSVIQRGKTGVAQYLFALLRAFLPYTDRHQFILFALEEDLPLFGFAGKQVQIVPVPERFRPAVKNIAWHQTEMPRLARQHKLDVLHIPSYRRMLWPRPCALVSTIHDLAPFQVANKYDWKRMFYGRVVVKRLARRQDHIIAISQNTASDIKTFFKLPDKKITIVHNGLEHDRFFPGPAETARAEVAKRHALQKQFFLYIARLEHPAKNHVRLISAFNEFKTATKSNWQLVLGGSDWNGAEAIHEAIRHSPFSTDIRSLGFVDNAHLPDLYRAAEAFVYPSLYEGFGMPPIESMACGCPVICSTRGSLGEVVGSAAAIINPDDTASIQRQLTLVAGDESLRNRLRTAGLAQARNFDWSKTAAETLEVYAKHSQSSLPCKPSQVLRSAQGRFF
ncbi:glycosyltransferase family 4 protein [Pedosphaera parvula]|uniref:Glycosyl transferase group 1 n=1 Tax=Pedosphaera parvula (strain Ellin514) TaxID=320771 RepID=B9XSZ7_PEDPL|nr:glycosyltransferase family 1 protein [Pedosphaera parvula]EEF57032.1 glycosyl transferase group 1 [Pedosphaera parvula Ellin514]